MDTKKYQFLVPGLSVSRIKIGAKGEIRTLTPEH